MGRPLGSKNRTKLPQPKEARTMAERAIQSGVVTAEDKAPLKNIFTCTDKDFLSINDFEQMTGLSYDSCAKIVREIKSISDIFGIQGVVHRVDYYTYLSNGFAG